MKIPLKMIEIVDLVLLIDKLADMMGDPPPKPELSSGGQAPCSPGFPH